MSINIRNLESSDYFKESQCLTDNPTYYNLAQVVSEVGRGRILEVGCGLGWVIKHLRAWNLDAWGLDSSRYIIEHSIVPEHCLLGDAKQIRRQYPTTFDVIVMKDVAQTLELQDLVEVITCLKECCKGYLFFLDTILEPQTYYAIRRSPEWYLQLFELYGFRQSPVQALLRKSSSLSNLFVFEPTRIYAPREDESPGTIIDPWLVRLENTKVAALALTTTEEESAAFQDSCRDLWLDTHLVPLGGDRLSRERLGLVRSGSDYALFCDDTTRLSQEWLLAVLAQFRSSSVGAVVSPVQWLNGPEEQPQGDYWNRFPIFFRTLAYQQSQGSKSKFDELGWRVAKIKTPISSAPSEPRVFNEVPSVTVITAFDDSKVELLDRYFEALQAVQYPRDRLHIHIWDDSTGLRQELEGRLSAVPAASKCYHRANTNDYWLTMADEDYYKWKGILYPISVRVAGLYNRAVRGITTDRVLFWESDTIPANSDFLSLLSEALEDSDGGVSGHYVCRAEKKSLAWEFPSLMPLTFEWVSPGQGVQVVDGVPHGLLLMNSWCLERFRFSALANDPRDFRGPDLVMGRDLKQLGIRLKIHWDVPALHYEPDGETFLRPEA